MVHVRREVPRSANVLQVGLSPSFTRQTGLKLPRSKTSLMDPRFAPAWIAFAHAFSMEGEHDHAVTAYSTCARLYTGYARLVPTRAHTLTPTSTCSSHLPLMFVGMEHMILSNLKLAEEALLAAHHMCDSDPLLYNERGVMAFMNEECVISPRRMLPMYSRALATAMTTQSDSSRRRSSWRTSCRRPRWPGFPPSSTLALRCAESGKPTRPNAPPHTERND